MKYKLRYIEKILLVFVGIMFLSFAASAKDTVILLDEEESQFVGDRGAYYLDESSEFSIDKRGEETFAFESIHTSVYTHTANPGIIWSRFTAKSVGDSDKWIDVHNSNLSQVSFFKINAKNEIVATYETGALLGKNTRLKSVNTFWFPLIEEGDTATYTFFIAAKSRLALEIPLFVGTEAVLYKNAEMDNFLAYFFIGSLTVLILYNLFFFFYLKKRIFLLYSLNVLSFLIVGPYLCNFPLPEYLFGVNLTYNYPNTWIWITLVTSALFAIEYLELKKYAPLLRKILIAEVALYLLAVPMAFIVPGPWLIKVYIFFTFMFYMTCLFVGYYFVFFKKSKDAWLFAIGWTALVGGIVFLIVVRNGGLPYNVYTRNISYFGFLIEAILFAIAIGKHMNELRIEQIKLNLALKNSNEELLNVNESLDSFNYHVSHDLKTALNNTKALTRMVKKYVKKGDHKKLNEVVSKLELVTNNGIETVQSFLSLGKIDNLFKTQGLEKLEIEGEIDRVLEFNDLAEEIAVSIKVDELHYVNMHRKAFESIFLNLFTNTIKYSEKLPTANLYFEVDGAKIIFIYKDFGNGIDLEKYGENIFKPFERGEINAGIEGTGVGLYILHRIVTNYNGQIRLESEPNKGIKMIMEFPLEMKQGDHSDRH